MDEDGDVVGGDKAAAFVHGGEGGALEEGELGRGVIVAFFDEKDFVAGGGEDAGGDAAAGAGADDDGVAAEGGCGGGREGGGRETRSPEFGCDALRRVVEVEERRFGLGYGGLTLAVMGWVGSAVVNCLP